MPNLDQRVQRLGSARLYAIVDTGYVQPERIPSITEQLVLGGVDLIQLRAKKLPLSAVEAMGRVMRTIIPADGPLFILNDHPELVPAIGADGIHVGQDDLSVAEARLQGGVNVIVGKSTHALDQAIAAEKEGADYIGVGPIFATLTKPDYVPVGPALIGQVASAVRVPQFCIGGINEQTLHEVLAAGAKRVVIVSALLQSEDIPAYCRRVRTKLSRGVPPSDLQQIREWAFTSVRESRHITEVREALAQRPQLDAAVFAERYFPSEKQSIAERLWLLTQKHSVADISGVVLNDTFVDDLRMDDLDSMSLVELAIDLEGAFHITVPDGRLAEIRTFGQLVDEIYRRTKDLRVE
jgi:thiamine-phosphate pyrophosphorylase